MAYGLQLYSATGQLDLDSSSWRILRHVQTSTIYLAGAGGTVYLNVAGMLPDALAAGFVLFVDKVYAYAMSFGTGYIAFTTPTNVLSLGGRYITVTVMRYK